jgi:hypothetical protein
MLKPSKQSFPEQPGIDWLGIKKTFVIQVVVLLAASGAVIKYINRSSGVAQAEFARAMEPMVLGQASLDKPLDRNTNVQTPDGRRAHIQR